MRYYFICILLCFKHKEADDSENLLAVPTHKIPSNYLALDFLLKKFFWRFRRDMNPVY